MYILYYKIDIYTSFIEVLIDIYTSSIDITWLSTMVFVVNKGLSSPLSLESPPIDISH